MTVINKWRVTEESGNFIEFLTEAAADAWQLANGGDVEEIEEEAPSDPQGYVEGVIDAARLFGSRLITKIVAENVLLGITGAGMTNTVRKALAQVVNALQTGSLYDAIDEARAIPPEDKDATFITDARLLVFINEIEVYLGEEPSVEL